MPAMTLGMEEVERRLRSLRRRLNGVALQHFLYCSSSAALLLCTVLLVVGLYAPATVFRVAYWAGAASATVTVLWSAWSLFRRWLDRDAVAWMADRRGQLADRLTTLLALRSRRVGSPLAPVLLAQTLALAERWHPQRLAPRRIPRSIFTLAGSLLLFAAAVLLVSNAPPAPAAMPKPGPGDSDESALARAVPEGAVREALTGSHGEGAAPDHGTGAAPRTDDDPPGQLGSEKNPESAPFGPLAGLPDQLRKTLHRTFRAQATDRPRGLGTGRSSRKDGAPEGEPRTGTGDRGKGPGNKSPSAARQQLAASREGQSQRTQRQTQRDPKDARPREGRGGSGGAGRGSTNDRAVGDKQDGHGGTGTTRADGTFKLTLTSFLDTVPQPQASGSPGKGRAGSADHRKTAEKRDLSNRQRTDDALRKALVPAEYEEVVRRVYLDRARE